MDPKVETLKIGTTCSEWRFEWQPGYSVLSFAASSDTTNCSLYHRWHLCTISMILYQNPEWYNLAMKTRTNLHLDNDALKIAMLYADARGISLGVAVSELIRHAEQNPAPPITSSIRLRRDEHGFLVVKSSGPSITSEMVKAELENDFE